MVVYIRDLTTVKNKWLTVEEFDEGLALCQSFPGAISMNVAAYAGLKMRGTPGALFAYIAFGFPAFVLILLLSHLYMQFHALQQIQALFAGLKIAIVAIIVNATASFKESSANSFRDTFITLSAAFLFWTGLNPFLVVLGGATAGFFFYPDLRSLARGKPTSIINNRKSILHAGIILLLLSLCATILYIVNRSLADIALIFAKIDLFSFGGGFAALPLMLHQIVDVRNWLTNRTFMDGIALGQITPGPVIITATFIGYILHGLKGAVISTIAIFSPSFLLVLFVVPFLDKLKGSPLFPRGVRGVIATFSGLLLFVAIKFAIIIHWDIIAILFGLSALAALRYKVYTLYVVVCASLVSLFLFR